MGSISPVIQSFLEGQAGRTEVLNKARDWQLRKQQLDQLAKQFDITSAQHDKQLKMESDRFQLEHDIAKENHKRQIMEDYSKGLIPTPQETQPTSIPIPGMGDVSAPLQHNVPVGTPITTDTAFGPMTINRPMNPQEQATAMLPVEKQAWESKANIDADAYVKKMMPELNAKLESQKNIADMKAAFTEEMHKMHEETLNRGIDARVQAAQIAAQSHMMTQMMMNGVEPSANGFRDQVNRAVSSIAMGNSDYKDHGPIVGRAAQAMMDRLGFATPAKGFNDKVFPNANNAVDFMNNVDNLKATVGTPLSTGQRVGNVLANLTGIDGLSTYKSQFEMFKASEVPKLDLAVGLTAGTLARSPKLVNLFKSLYPQPGDTPEVVQTKKVFGTDIFLGGAQKNLSNLPTEQRKMYWKEIVERNPDLMKLGGIASSLSKAMETGTYTPGSGYKSALDAAKGQF